MEVAQVFLFVLFAVDMAHLLFRFLEMPAVAGRGKFVGHLLSLLQLSSGLAKLNLGVYSHSLPQTPAACRIP